MSSTKAWLRARIRPIAVRDRTIAEQKSTLTKLRGERERYRQQIETLTQDLEHTRTAHHLEQERQRERANGTPSFQHLLHSLRQQANISVRYDGSAQTPLMQIPYKLRNYRLAQSHGIAVPEILAVWESAAAVRDLGHLPAQFVLKSDGGAGSSGVFLLERTGTDGYTMLGTTSTFSEHELTSHLASLDSRRVRPPFFVEAFLNTGPSTGPIPEDVKIYASHGRILQVMLRRVGKHGAPSTIRTRFVDAEGEDLGSVALDRTGDDTIPLPQWLPEMVATARHLSRAIGVPFCRVDLYDGVDGPILGEITRAPGGTQRYSEDHDRWMGEQWLRGAVDLGRDLAGGRPYGVLHGDHPATNFYPAGHLSQAADPGPWQQQVVHCGRWC
ncbi:ATP-grasp domain-containing protein [Ruania zhangjianzhongii]|uniref:ATP-grasp domain-containing protein n=1 Tax=Ruania zhangjianzhongii TaxID=2603206 RepID=UPI0011C8D7D9|nr:ATP-grasp fold amidoligase family protein [Ruania zhangjianzhongii]